MSFIVEIIGVWSVVFFTLAIFSFLYRDNPFYKIAEHVFIGVATGYTFILALGQTIKPNFVDEILGALSGDQSKTLWRIGAGVLGVMLLLRLNRKTSWLSTWPLALLVGTFAALRMTGLTQSDLIGQINGTIQTTFYPSLPFFSWDSAAFFNNFVIIGGVVCVLIYFFFSLEHRGVLKVSSNVGIYFLMVTFGSSYGYTVMARVSLLIGRVRELCTYATVEYGYASIICAVLIFGALFLKDILSHRAT